MTRAEQATRNRKALLTAAEQVFLERGYHGTTVEAIAGKAGFTIGALYSRFGGKAEVFLALLEERIERRAEQFRDLARSTHEAPRDAARRWAEIMRREPDWSLLVIEFRVHAARDPHLGAAYAELHERAIAHLAVNIAASVGLPSGTPEVERLARAGLALSTGSALARAAEGERFTDELYEEMTVAISERLTAQLTGAQPGGWGQ